MQGCSILQLGSAVLALTIVMQKCYRACVQNLTASNKVNGSLRNPQALPVWRSKICLSWSYSRKVLLAFADGFIMLIRVPVLTVKSSCRSVRRLQSLFDHAGQDRQTAAGEGRTP